MIELKNVTKYFHTNEGRKYILDDVTMTLPDGNIGILGRNGTGKSTLMRMLGKIEFPQKGRIGSAQTFSWPLALSSGFVGTMTGRSNVKFVCQLYGKSDKERGDIIEFVKDFSELGEYFTMPIKTYSSGMRARLNFGLSLAFDFDYLLIDETLSVGDARFRIKAKEMLRKKIKHSQILLVSHEMNMLKEFCHTGLLLHEGKLHYFDNIDDAVRAYADINKGVNNNENIF